ncbi:MAG: ABC transporter ATP-binding protein [Saprospiraceae bacterium]|nr:ABC transporter ATP-binding protein [Saprospiraceae bacterium]
MAEKTRISLSNIGKKYKHWVIKNVSIELSSAHHYGITGRNGAGKSTLLRIISGYTSPTLGKLSYFQENDIIDMHSAARMVSYAAPYIDLIEELTVSESYSFHAKFHSMQPLAQSLDGFLDGVQLKTHQDVLVGDLSSGLMQRLKVGLAILTDTPVLLLDEPTSYLDSYGKDWYRDLLNRHSDNRLLAIASNDQFDIYSCTNIIDIHNYVPASADIAI